MEVFFSFACLAGMLYAGWRGFKWMSRVGRLQNRNEQPLTPNDLRVLEESAARLMAELRAAADECVDRVERACGEAERRVAAAHNAVPQVQNVVLPSTAQAPTDLPANPAEIARREGLTRGEVELIASLRSAAGL